MNTATISPGTIVVAVDGSDPAHRAVQWAAAQAHLEGRALTLVHVTDREGELPMTLRTVSREDFTRVDHTWRASHLLLTEASAFAETAWADVPVRSVSATGGPRAVLRRLSESAHLLVLGSRGRGVVRSRLLGSVSVAVVKSAQCPVLVIRTGDPALLRDGVVVAADATPQSRPILEFAFQQASLHDMPLTVMHCLYAVPVTATGMAGGAVRALPDAAQHERLLAETMAGLGETYPDVRVTRTVVNGLVGECLTQHPRPWDLVVVGRHPIRWLSGATAVGVMEHSTCPVAIVPEAAPERVTFGTNVP